MYAPVPCEIDAAASFPLSVLARYSSTEWAGPGASDCPLRGLNTLGDTGAKKSRPLFFFLPRPRPTRALPLDLASGVSAGAESELGPPVELVSVAPVPVAAPAAASALALKSWLAALLVEGAVPAEALTLCLPALASQRLESSLAAPAHGWVVFAPPFRDVEELAAEPTTPAPCVAAPVGEPVVAPAVLPPWSTVRAGELAALEVCSAIFGTLAVALMEAPAAVLPLLAVVALSLAELVVDTGGVAALESVFVPCWTERVAPTDDLSFVALPPRSPPITPPSLLGSTSFAFFVLVARLPSPRVALMACPADIALEALAPCLLLLLSTTLCVLVPGDFDAVLFAASLPLPGVVPVLAVATVPFAALLAGSGAGDPCGGEAVLLVLMLVAVLLPSGKGRIL